MKTYIIIGFIALLLALALSNFRYTTTRLSDSTAYQVDNWTGRAWFMAGPQKI